MEDISFKEDYSGSYGKESSRAERISFPGFFLVVLEYADEQRLCLFFYWVYIPRMFYIVFYVKDVITAGVLNLN